MEKLPLYIGSVFILWSSLWIFFIYKDINVPVTTKLKEKFGEKWRKKGYQNSMVFLVVGLLLVYQYFMYRPPSYSQTDYTKLEALSINDGLDESNEIAKKKDPDSRLVFVTDNQGDNDFFIQLKDKQEVVGNMNEKAKQWFYVDVEDPKLIDNNEEIEKHEILPKDYFVVSHDNENTKLLDEKIFGRVPVYLYTTDDITEEVKNGNQSMWAWVCQM